MVVPPGQRPTGWPTTPVQFTVDTSARVRIELPAPSPITHAEFRDEDGTVLRVTVAIGDLELTSPRLSRTAATLPTARVSIRTTNLVFFVGAEEVAQRPVQLSTGQLTVIHP